MSPRRPGPPLSRERIVAEALALIDEAGVDGCSLRAVAARLGVTPMALYGHVTDKEDLLDAVLDAVLATIPGDDVPADPIAALTELGHRYRAAFARHPNAAPLLADRPTPQGPVAQVLMARVVGLLRMTGLGDAETAAAWTLIAQFTMGTVLAEHEGDRRLPALLEGLGLRDVPDADARFAFGLQVLADGLRARATAGPVDP